MKCLLSINEQRLKELTHIPQLANTRHGVVLTPQNPSTPSRRERAKNSTDHAASHNGAPFLRHQYPLALSTTFNNGQPFT
jgi:hypothetical protein